MDPQTLERLMIDRSLGVVGPDVERLIEAALKADPSSARLAEEYAEAVRLARLVVREGAPARALPGLRAWGLARTAASRRRWAVLAGAGAVAAAVLIGLVAGHVVSQAWRPAGRSSQAGSAEARAVRHAAGEAALPGQQPRDGEAGAFQRNGPAGDFWSARRLYLQASGGAAGRLPLVWTSPARQPGVHEGDGT